MRVVLTYARTPAPDAGPGPGEVQGFLLAWKGIIMPKIRFPVSLLVPAVALAALGCARTPTASTPATVAAKPAAASATPLQLTLPAPTGQDYLGVVSLHLIDHSRTDPWVPGHQVRQLMISIWYPARDTARYPVTPWLEPAAAAHFEES